MGAEQGKELCLVVVVNIQYFSAHYTALFSFLDMHDLADQAQNVLPPPIQPYADFNNGADIHRFRRFKSYPAETEIGNLHPR